MRKMLEHWIWFASMQGISLHQKLQMLKDFSDPEELYYADEAKLASQCTPELVQFLEDKDLTQARQIVKQCAALHIHILTYRDAAYPSRLKHIYDPPLVLYYKGLLPVFDMQPVIGVVGTRKASAYGKTVAMDMSRELAASGALVISGGAAGIDSQALQGAIQADAPTVAVLGNGVDVCFPATNKGLFQKIEERGCLLSEYPPGTSALPWQFPRRNRIISGLSNGVLVIEAPKKSGALITARDAMEQGRDVFVVPGNINTATCMGSNALLQEGALAVFSGWDVLKDYAPWYPGVQQLIPKVPDSRQISWVAEQILAPNETCNDKKYVDNIAPSAYSDQSSEKIVADPLSRKLLECLTTEPIPVDQVIAQVQAPAAEVLGALTKLALLGMVINHPGRLVSVKRSNGG